MTLQALADGIADAAVLQVYEQRMREPAERRPSGSTIRPRRWRGRWRRSKRAAAGRRDPVGAIALACALGYLDLRFAGEWRAGHPRLVAWLDAFAAAVPAFAATALSG